GKLALLSKNVKSFGYSQLLLTGAGSFQKSERFQPLLKGFEKESITFFHEVIKTEPSPSMVDDIVNRYKKQNIDVITAIGGGSVIDAGKAVSAMMTKKTSVIDYLEGIGSKKHDGKKISFIAVPTTAGTGSEATKNAVISEVGRNGFKKSLRHDNFIPDIAIIDPALTLGCPENITAACGMDALTQLIESLVSTKASIITDSLVLGALQILGDSLIRSLKNPNDISIREKISYASYISGLALANAGLGVVHGFASVIGGILNIPHGVICGTLLAQVVRQTVETLISTDPDSPALHKYARVAILLAPSLVFEDPVKGSRHLITILEDWTDQLNMPRL
ncbi:MAG: iron-containing alcohol dehydrogenase, partial [Desulfobacteraceae bacterium]|nr:iron-containing alcohol dehydrogenase [Desulfobacteraceae bacterium]